MVKYKILLIDPPWVYRDKALSGNRGAGCKYPLLDHNKLKSLPISEISDDNSCLFMWVTMPQLDKAFELMSVWGFEYKTVAFTWIKTNKRSDSLFWGMGRWTRSNAELCLLGIKGKPKRLSAAVHSVIKSKIQRHSQKPAEVRERIVKLCGNLPKIEIFARETTEGWDALGFDIDGKDIFESINNLLTYGRQRDNLETSQPAS